MLTQKKSAYLFTGKIMIMQNVYIMQNTYLS